MTNIKRIRIDPQGLLTQNQQGMIRRIPLAPEVLEMLSRNPATGLASMRKHLPDLSPFFKKAKSVDARIDVAMEEAECLTRPLRIYYGIEPRCNLTCAFCGPRDFHDRCVPASVEQESSLIGQIADAGAFQIQFTGGEIGVRGFDLIRALEQARMHGLAVILSTNGVWRCIEGKNAFMRELSRFDNIIQAKISIEGKPEFHDSVRGKGTYAEALNTLGLLSEYGLNPRISSTIFRESCTFEHLYHLIGLAKTFGAGFQPIPLRRIARARRMVDQTPTPEQLRDYTREASRIRKETGLAISFNFDIFDGRQHVPIFDVHRPVSCGAPLWGCHVTHTGEVYPCGFVQSADKQRSFLAGVIGPNRNLLDIWLKSEVLRDVRLAGKDARCQECDQYGRGCWGGCWVMALVHAGRVNAMDPYCFH